MSKPVPVKFKLQNGFEVLAPFKFFQDIMEEVFDFKMRQDDIVIATFAKAGNFKSNIKCI